MDSGGPLLLRDLECGVCLQLLCDPVTSPTCGHSFCRNCIIASLRKSNQRCPVCRKPLLFSTESAPVNFVLRNIIQRVFPAQYEERLRDALLESTQWSSMLPLFSMPEPLFPGQVLTMHMFEPRYRLMVERVCGPEAAVGFGFSAGGDGVASAAGNGARFDPVSAGFGSTGLGGTAATPSGGGSSSSGKDGQALHLHQMDANCRSNSTGSDETLGAAADAASSATAPSSGDDDSILASSATRLSLRGSATASRRFGHIATYSPSTGSIGCVAEICGLQPLPGGAYLIQVKGVQRFRLHSAWEEPGTHGLMYGKGEALHDFDEGACVALYIEARRWLEQHKFVLAESPAGVSPTVPNPALVAAAALAAAASSGGAAGAGVSAAEAAVAEAAASAASAATSKLSLSGLPLSPISLCTAMDIVRAAVMCRQQPGPAFPSAGSSPAAAGASSPAASPNQPLGPPSAEDRAAARQREVALAVWRTFAALQYACVELLEGMSADSRQRVEASLGPLPTEVSPSGVLRLSYWLAGMLPLQAKLRIHLINTTSLGERLWISLQLLWPRFGTSTGIDVDVLGEFVECGEGLEAVAAGLRKPHLFLGGSGAGSPFPLSAVGGSDDGSVGSGGNSTVGSGPASPSAASAPAGGAVSSLTLSIAAPSGGGTRGQPTPEADSGAAGMDES